LIELRAITLSIGRIASLERIFFAVTRILPDDNTLLDMPDEVPPELPASSSDFPPDPFIS
jgi:hypothetical protein